MLKDKDKSVTTKKGKLLAWRSLNELSVSQGDFLLGTLVACIFR